MEINTLQSVIKRNGAAIRNTEADIDFFYSLYKSYNKGPHKDVVLRQAQKAKRQLKKLVELQKTLKKEVAQEVTFNRLVNELVKLHD